MEVKRHTLRTDAGLAMLEAAASMIFFITLLTGAIFLFEHLSTERSLKYLTDRISFDTRSSFLSFDPGSLNTISLDTVALGLELTSMADTAQAELNDFIAIHNEFEDYYFDLNYVRLDVDPNTGVVSYNPAGIVNHDFRGTLAVPGSIDQTTVFQQGLDDKLNTEPESAQVPVVNYNSNGATAKFVPAAVAIGMRLFIKRRDGFVSLYSDGANGSYSSDMVIQIIGGAEL